MGQHILNVRVRPPRVTVLLSRDAGPADVLRPLTFFSRLWGGRYSQLLAVDPAAPDPLTEFRLSASRPEFVYGVGLDDARWADAVFRASQPRRYCPLGHVFDGELRQFNYEGFVTAGHALVHRFREHGRRPGPHRPLRLVDAGGHGPWPAMCAAHFGVPIPDLRPEYHNGLTTFTADTSTAFIDLAIGFVAEYQESWLDLTGHALNTHSYTGLVPPTVVLVGSPAQDLSLFWNLRAGCVVHHPAWVIPVPAADAADPAVLERLRAWLVAFLPYGTEPNHCQVVSCSVSEGDCARVAGRLRAALAGTPFQFVDPQPPPARLPHVVPFEYDATWPVEIKGRALTLVPPKPRAFEDVGPGAWVVDLLRDVKTGRAVLDLHLPSSPVVPELLNGPCPPTFDHRVIPRAGDGSEAVNLICSGERGTVNLFLPTDEEVLEEILRDHGYEPVPDEKRSSYLPVIKRFGGLFLAGNAFAGQSGAILAALAGGPKTVEEIRGKCRLGDGKLEGPNYLQRVEQMLTRETERTRRISRRRFEHYSRRTTPEGVTLKALLEFWADRSVLTRHWKIGPCRRCQHTFFQPNLNLQRRVLCPGCGHRIGLPPAVPVGYSLHRGVRLAVEQGVMPVALTGRFLRNMTHRGFLWLPGVKYKRGAERGDIDLLACCDGYLVFGECKRLDRTPPDAKVWAEVVDQFLRTAAVARDCGAHLAVLACQGSTYPPEVEKEIESRLAGSIPHLLLAKDDLEVGYQEVPEGPHKRWLQLADLIPRAYPETPGPSEGGPRFINVGWGVHTSG